MLFCWDDFDLTERDALSSKGKRVLEANGEEASLLLGSEVYTYWQVNSDRDAMDMGMIIELLTTSAHLLDTIVPRLLGDLTICDRPGLLKLDGAAYGQPETEYERLLGASER